MAQPVMATAANADFTGFNNAANGFRFCMSSTQISRIDGTFDVTQQNDVDVYGTPSSTNVTCAVYRANRRYIMRISGLCYVQTSADAGTTWTYAFASTSPGTITGAVNTRIGQCVLQRNTRLINITSDEDTIPTTVFDFGKVSYSGSIAGYLLASETPLDNDINPTTQSTLLLPFSTGSVQALVHFDGINQTINFHDGGPHRIVTPFRLSGDVTRSNSPMDIMTFSASIDLSNGQTMTGTAIMDMIRMNVDYEAGAPLTAQFTGVVSDWSMS
jgi:hypothetical protein